MNAFELSLPDTLADAARKAGPNSAFKAAGIDLIDRLKERIDDPETVVDLLRLRDELGGIQATANGAVRLGALTTLQELADATALDAPGFGALREACGEAATPQVRARATLGGNLLQKNRCWYYRSNAFSCAHDGSGDRCLAWHGENKFHALFGTVDCVRVHPSNAAPALVALGAEVEIRGADADSSRRIPIRALYPQSPAARAPEHVLADEEILVAVHLPASAAAGRSAYRESREKLSFDWATTAAAAHLVVEGGKIARASVCLGAVAPNPWPLDDVAERITGQTPSRELFADAARRAFRRAQPLRHNAYKVEVGQAILVDALAAAAGLED